MLRYMWVKLLPYTYKYRVDFSFEKSIIRKDAEQDSAETLAEINGGLIVFVKLQRGSR